MRHDYIITVFVDSFGLEFTGCIDTVYSKIYIVTYIIVVYIKAISHQTAGYQLITLTAFGE